MTWLPVNAPDLHQGMIVKKDPRDRGERPHTVGRYTGQCHAGIHFGMACYAWIGKWWVMT